MGETRKKWEEVKTKDPFQNQKDAWILTKESEKEIMEKKGT